MDVSRVNETPGARAEPADRTSSPPSSSAVTSALAVTRALGRAGVPVVSVFHSEREYASASQYVTRRVLAPDPVVDAAGFVQILRSLGEAHPGSLLVPACDEALLAVAEHRDTLSEHFAVACMDSERANRCLDKKQTYAIAEGAGSRSLAPSRPRHWRSSRPGRTRSPSPASSSRA